MKFKIGKDKLYLLLAYLVLALLVRAIFADFIGTATVWQPVIVLALLSFIILSHDSLLKAIRQATGSFTSREQGIFNEVLELNKNIQNSIDADQVLKLVEVMLKDQLNAEKVIIYLNENVQTGTLLKDKEEISKEYSNILQLWPPESQNSYQPSQNLIENIVRTDGIFTLRNNLDFAKEMFAVTGCDLAIPVIHNRQLLCLILVCHYEPEALSAYSEEQLKILDYLSAQLALILDRIRVYQQVMLQTAMDHAEKMQVMQSISSNIAHEMRTPLSGIRASISGVEDYLPELIAAYKSCHDEKKGGIKPIREDHLKSLVATPDRVTLMIDQANNVIDMLLMNLRETSLDENQMNVCTASECIEQAMERYPFKSSEREKVVLDLSSDFKFLGIESMFVYVLFNLLKNALYSIRSAQKGQIYINLETGVKADPLNTEQVYNAIYFRDTGVGIPDEIRQRVFDSFFTTKEGGTGAGLAYCKRTIQNFQGKIKCDSVVGEYCEFKIYFPAIKLSS